MELALLKRVILLGQLNIALSKYSLDFSVKINIHPIKSSVKYSNLGHFHRQA